jgi:hypothetical protein
MAVSAPIDFTPGPLMRTIFLVREVVTKKALVKIYLFCLADDL